MAPFGEYINLLGVDHLLYIAILVLVAALLFTNPQSVRSNRDQITIVIFLFSLAQQIILYGSYFILFEFDLGESLPLHISRINTIIGFLFLLTKDRRVYILLCYFGLFAWLSFLYPSRVFGIIHPIGISFLVSHVITLLMPFYGMIAYDMRLKKEDKNFAFLCFLGYFVFVYFFNPLVDGNYFYLKYRPIFATAPDYIYLPGALLVTYILFSLGEWLYERYQKIIKGKRIPHLSPVPSAPSKE